MTRSLRSVQTLALAAWFVALWCLLWGEVTAANLLSGLAVGAVVVLLAGRIAAPPRPDHVRVSPVGVVVFVVHVLWSLVRSNLFLAWEIVTPTNTIATGNVTVPMRSTSTAIAMAVSNVVTLTPGTVTVGVADDSSSITIAVLHLGDPAAVIDDVRRTERLAIKAFGSAEARRVVAEEAR